MSFPDGETLIAECKAGKMDWDGSNVTPDRRKGKLMLVRDPDELCHVWWWDREANTKIDLVEHRGMFLVCFDRTLE